MRPQRTPTRFWLAGLGCCLTAGLVGCQTGRGYSDARPIGDRAPARDGVSAYAEPSTSAEMEGYRSATAAFPTGERNSSVLLVTKRVPEEVRVGQPFEYIVEVTNISDMTLEDVVVYDEQAGGEAEGGDAMAMPQPPQDAEGENAEATGEQVAQAGQQQPNQRQRQNQQQGRQQNQQNQQQRQNQQAQGQMGGQWQVGSLAPGETRTFTAQGNAQQVGQLRSCTRVEYTPTVCLAVNVVQPELTLTKAAPETVLACDEITLRYEVRNVGTGTAQNVVLVDELPEGLTTTDGQRQIRREIGQLAAGQSRTVTVAVQAEDAGQFGSPAYVTYGGEGDQRAQAQAQQINVTKPNLVLDVAAPDLAYVGQPLTYTVRVGNTGNAPARDLIIRQRLPEGAAEATATAGGRIDAGDMVWRLQPLPPGAQTQVQLTLTGDEIGQFDSTAIANAYCAQPVSDRAQTQLAGIAALLLEVVDNNDPVQIGNTTSYMIVVTNQGSQADAAVQISARLPQEFEFVNASGADRFEFNQGERAVNFFINQLDPGDSARMNVIVRAQGAGDVRFYAEMTSESLGAPVRETESTKLFGDDLQGLPGLQVRPAQPNQGQ